MNSSLDRIKGFFSKAACLGMLISVSMLGSLSAATIHIDNTIDDIVWVNALGGKKMYSNTVQPHATVFVNTWFDPLVDIIWEIGDVRWVARPSLQVGALQTEGRLTIGKDGAYTFKSCALCGEQSGQAQKVART